MQTFMWRHNTAIHTILILYYSFSLSPRAHTRAQPANSTFIAHTQLHMCVNGMSYTNTHTHIAIIGTTICWVECASARETERDCERLQLNWTEKRQNNTLQHRATAKPREEKKKCGEIFNSMHNTPHTIRQRNRGNVCMYRSNVHIQLCIAYGTCEPESVCVWAVLFCSAHILQVCGLWNWQKPLQTRRTMKKKKN